MINKYFKKIDLVLLVIVVCFLSLVGCEEVIDVDLNSATPKIVIEGSLMDDGSNTFVKISKTTDYFNPGIYPQVSNASVQISDTKGNKYNLHEVEPGYYETDEIVPEDNETYTMIVNAEGETYEASSTFEKPMSIDSIWYKKGDSFDTEADGYTVSFLFQDHPEKRDYARAKLYVNGIHESEGLATYRDNLTNGKQIEYEQYLSDTTVTVGDKITLELITLDKYAYNYFNVYGSIMNNGGEMFGASSTDNPPSNISNGALGFFGAYGVARKSVIISD